MKVEQRKWTQAGGWQQTKDVGFLESPQLVIVFGARPVLSDAKHYEEVKAAFPNSHLLMLSTAGEILDNEVSDNTLSLSAIKFEKTDLKFACASITDTAESQALAKKIAGQLPAEGLVHVMVFSDGLKVNGTSLVKGLTEALPENVSVTGGLVGDGSDFKETLVGLDEAPHSGQVVVIGFYGDQLKVGYGSLGGWDPFGPERLITKSKHNVLYEIDGRPALALYKQYLGDQAKDLPSSGLLFPMSIRLKEHDDTEVEVVRTLLSVSEEDQSMTFAGDMPEGVYAKLMKANFERLVDGAYGAANMSLEAIGQHEADLAILISCIGRKLVLKERIEEEIDAVRSVVGEKAAIAGFYSYGEICPTAATEKQCQLHNQTMTITTFREL
jgi:hypothetical protein